MTSHRTSRTRLAIGCLVAALVVGGIALTRDDTTSTTPDAVGSTGAAIDEVTIERGDLLVSDSVDGTVEETGTIAVVHRVEGGSISTGVATTAATSSSAATSGESTPTAADGATASAVGPAGRSTTATTTTVTTTTTTTPTPSSVPGPSTTTLPGGGPQPSGPPDPSSPPDTSMPPTTDTTDVTAPSTVPSSSSVPVTSTPTPTTPTAPTGSGPVPTAGAATGAAPGGATSAASTTEVLTGVASIGDEVASGDVVYSVNGSPIVALAGALPAWRTMSASSSDGADIAQLEAALVALGYDPDGNVEIDAAWDAATTASVRLWQRGLGVDDTGEVTLGRLVFVPHDAAVASVTVAVGDTVSDGDEVVALTGVGQQVVVDVPVELQARVEPAQTVEVGGVEGVVSRLRSTDDGTVQALVVPSEPLADAAGASVAVTFETIVATDALIVPTEAVVSLLDGSYAVDVAQGARRRHVPVEIVGVSGIRTAIESDELDAGSTVLSPA